MTDQDESIFQRSLDVFNPHGHDPDYLDARQITLIVFFLDQPADGTPMTLFFDNVRLAREATGKVEVRRK